MTAPIAADAFLPATATTPTVPAPATTRHDGWTPDRQRRFLEALADGHGVEDASRLAGLSHQSAYAFRRRPAGAAFALAWQAALLMARDRLADVLMVRAIDGQTETIIRDDGSRIERHRYDNRLATVMLARLDRLADATQGDTTHRDARRVIGQFDAFLDSLAEQCVADADGTVPAPQLPQLRTPNATPALADEEPWHEVPVWHCPENYAPRTFFPPPPGFDGAEQGVFGDEDYARALSDAELAQWDAALGRDQEAQTTLDAVERDAWFTALALESPGKHAPDVPAAP